jgi:predicted nucleotidyltransferase
VADADGPGAGAPLRVPQGMTPEQFRSFASAVRNGAGHLGSDIRVQGSRTAGTARPDSDIDIAIRVSPERFNQLIRERFGTPNPGSAKEHTMLHALEERFGYPVDISVIREGGPFDRGPWVPLPNE